MTFKEELQEILTKQLTVLINLKQLAFEKTDIIVGNRVEDLEQITKSEEALINEMGLLEEQRVKFLDTWGVATDTPVSNVIEKIPEDNEQLLHIKEEMSNVLEELHSRNALNNDLITENLDWIDFNMNLITSSDTPTNYGKGSKEQGGNSIFDRKV